MNSLQIEYFLALCQYMNFTKTANALYVSQPAISKQISSLERELGISLVDRRDRQIKLTKNGEMYRDAFQKMQTELKKLHDRAGAANARKQDSLSIGLLHDWNTRTMLKDVVSAMQKSFPEISISVESLPINSLLQRIEIGQLDVIIVYSGCVEQQPGLSSLVFDQIPSRIFFSIDHPLASKGDLSVEDFANETFFVESKEYNHISIQRLGNCCSNYGFIPKHKELPNLASVISSIHMGLGVALLDSQNKIGTNPAFRYLDTVATNDIAVAWKKNDTRSIVGAFINEIHLIGKL